MLGPMSLRPLFGRAVPEERSLRRSNPRLTLSHSLIRA